MTIIMPLPGTASSSEQSRQDAREDGAARIIQQAWRQRRQSTLKAESRWADATIHARVQVRPNTVLGWLNLTKLWR